jgi:hydroxymethylpyrimidine/phosphomethylpyrimidine kinase
MTRVLVVGGHDPSGAGVEADGAALADLDVEIVVVVTAHTDQDESGVRSIGAVDARAWLNEALGHVGRGVDAIKLGLLPGVEHVRAAVQLVRAARAACAANAMRSESESRQRYGCSGEIAVVLDPVIAASSGARFLDAAAIETMRGELLAESVIVTPNVAELAELARASSAKLAASLSARVEAAQILLGLGARAVIAKGGHGLEDPVRDLVIESDRAAVRIEHARVPGGKIRGSGCRFASRLAGRMAGSWTLEAAARDASEHVTGAIVRASGG